MPALINVCGSGFSGTTMLDLMLGNATNAFSCGEIYAWFRPTRTHHFKIKCSCPDDPCPYWEKIMHFPENEFHKKAFDELKVDFLIDSSKHLTWVIDNNIWAKQNDFRVVNLLIWKKPIDHFYSYWKRGRGMMRWRRSYLNYYKRFVKTGLPFISVSFSELVSEPAAKLKDICSAIGMEYFQGKESFWEKVHHQAFGSLATRKQVEEKNSSIMSNKKYPPEFIKKAEQLSKMLAKDRTVKMILEKLEGAEVSRYNGSDEVYKKYEPTNAYPLWYYGLKFSRKIRRYFPEPWPHDQ